MAITPDKTYSSAPVDDELVAELMGTGASPRNSGKPDSPQTARESHLTLTRAESLDPGYADR